MTNTEKAQAMQAIYEAGIKIYEREIKICQGMPGMTQAKLEAHAWAQAIEYRNRELNKLAMI